MTKYYRRTNMGNIYVDLAWTPDHVHPCPYGPTVRLILLHNNEESMTNKRVYKSGNSFVLTLTAAELNHMRVFPGQFIRIDTLTKGRLRLSKCNPKIARETTPTH